MTQPNALPASLAALDSQYVIHLDQLSLLLAEGEQAAQFLNSQLTIDVSKLEDGRMRHAALCDFKGKAWAVLDVARVGDKYVCIGITDAMQAALAQFQKYSVFSKVTFSDITETAQAVFVQGEAPLVNLNLSASDLPQNEFEVCESEGKTIIKLNISEAGYLVFHLANTPSSNLRTSLQANLHYPVAVYDALSIAKGIPQVSGDNINTLVSQMFNLQAIDGIDFKKGCYMGQEVVARTRYLGKNKRAAYIVSVTPATVSANDVTLERQVGTGWRNAGNIIRSAKLESELWLLVVMPDDVTPQDQLRITQAPELMVTMHTLPYTIEQESRSVIKK